MTRRSNSTSSPRRRRRAALALTALALLGAITVGTVAAQSDRPTVCVGSGTVSAGETTTVGVVLPSAPNGLAGYYVELSVENGDTARIESASYPDRFGMTSDPVIGDDGGTVTLEAADVDGAIGPGATDVTLATVELAGTAPGEVTLSVDPIQFDADDGRAVQLTTRPGAVTVTGDGSGSADAIRSADGTDGTPAAGGGTDATTGAGPLPTALPFVVLAAFLAVARLRRRRG